jgi:hypothetical protein
MKLQRRVTEGPSVACAKSKERTVTEATGEAAHVKTTKDQPESESVPFIAGFLQTVDDAPHGCGPAKRLVGVLTVPLVLILTL